MSEIRTVEQLNALYPAAPGTAALTKECDYLTPAYAALIRASPFMVIATARDGAIDCSPRGDSAGFVDVRDERTLVIPDRPGNNRLDTLRNILVDPRVGLIFLIPGIGECLRVRGTARITADPTQLAAYSVHGKLPTSLVEITVEKVFFQCARAILRSKIWDPDSSLGRGDVPSAGAMLEDAKSFSREQALTYDATAAERLAANLY